MIKNIRSDSLKLSVTFLLFICFTFLPSYLPNTNERLWKNYYLLCIKKEFNYEKNISSFIWEQNISYENTGVNFTVFNDKENVKLKDLESRFDQRDPRLDPYMKNLKSYFFGDDSWNYIYIPADMPVQYVFLNLFLTLPGYGKLWIISDFNISKEILSVFITALFFILVINLKNKNRIFVSFSFISWINVILSGNFNDLVTFLIVFPAVFLIIDISIDFINLKIHFPQKSLKDNIDYNNLKGRLLYLCIVLLIPIAGRLTNGTFLTETVRITFPVLSCFSMLGLYFYFNRIRMKTKSHELFYPVSIIKEKKWDKINKPVLITIAALLIIVPVIFSIEAPVSGIKVPVPEKIDGAEDFSWDSLEKLHNIENNSVLPDISDYVMHAAYQDGFVYGAEYDFPVKNSELLIDSYEVSKESGRIEKYYETVLQYDDSWLENMFKNLKKGSISKMLFDQDRPVSVNLSERNRYLEDFTLCFGLFVFILFPFFFIDSLWTSNQLYGNKDNKRKFKSFK